MAAAADQPPANPMFAASNSSRPTTAEKLNPSAPVEPLPPSSSRPPSFVPSRKSVSTSHQDGPRLSTGDNGVAALDFQGSVDSNNDLPSLATIKKIENYHVLDRHGKSHTFRSLYTGKHVARRVLIIFVRHFFCGQCQEYLRTLSASITPDALLRLPLSTFIAVVGCGDPQLIDMYAQATNCPFPIYADPTRKLYQELGMVRTLALGEKPAYTSKNIVITSLDSILQGIKQIPKGLVNKAGDFKQIGGEFLFEPVDIQSPVHAVQWEDMERTLERATRENNEAAAAAAAAAAERKRDSSGSRLEPDSDDKETGVGSNSKGTIKKEKKIFGGQGHRPSEASIDGKNEEDEGEEKRVTWCHRMKTTRDHVEIPELMEVLGLDGQGEPNKDSRRWSKALETRKGTGLSMAGRMNTMKAEAGTGA
ncbi:AhpC/TSA antioxidant enzyme-domain-containing protein [Pseudoneurospora amorphoporcata]|uniref:AhpC/TSA antioxidant enzyme-domain-containing protein n=1 Tax=Pseudoneurospora amorphoporcata TaxID=241081 RepID=A0AAN6SKS3_9PEZI|nr:AhpC/TSA antioxidant enzyme-domain-containing protein [Pseudoneurospora amorphoporcata]